MNAAAIKVLPRGVWFKVHFYTEGSFLHGVLYIVAAGQPEVLRFKVNLHAIKNLLERRHGTRVGGFPGNIWKAAKNLGKSKIAKAIGSAVKSVVKSKYTGAVIAATAVAFPPVGVPAAAAYATANATLSTIESANKAAKEAKKLVAAGKGAVVQKHKVGLAALMKKSAIAKKKLRTLTAQSRAGNPEAKAGVRIFNIVAQHRKKMSPQQIASRAAAAAAAAARAQAGRRGPSASAQRAAAAAKKLTFKKVKKALPKGAIPGLIVTPEGRIVPGAFKKVGKGKGLLVNKGRVQRGKFRRVSGDDFAPLYNDVSLSVDDPRFDLGGDPRFGCDCS